MAQRNLTPNNQQEQDAYDDPTQVRRSLSGAEADAGSDPYAEAGADQAEAYANDSGNAVRERENKAAQGVGANSMNYSNVSEKVKTGKKLAGRLGNLKKLSPLTATIIFIIAGALITTLSFPGLILQHIEETITSALNDAEPAVNVRTRLAYKLKVDAVKNGSAESADGKCNVKCKFSTINNKTRKRMLASTGVKFELEKKAFGRYVIKSATFPQQGLKPALTVTNGNDFAAAVKDPLRASAFYKVFNPGTDPFLANNFVGRLFSRYGLKKTPMLTGDTEKENREQLARSLGIEEEVDGNGPNNNNEGEETDEDRLNNSNAKEVGASVNAARIKLDGASKATDVVGAVCTAYDVGKGVNAAYSAYKVAKYATLYMAIANAASQARDGELKPATMTTVGNMVTQLDMNKTYKDGDAEKNNPFYRKSFTDATAYKMDAYGDNIELSDRDKAFSLAPTGVSGSINQMTSLLVGAGSAVPAILAASHATCATAGSPVGAAVGCIGPALAGSIVPIVGNAAAFVICLGVGFVIGEVINGIISAALPGIIKGIVTGDVNAITENMTGPGLATAAHIGAGQILGSGMASMYGMTPGTSDDIKDYKTATAGVRADYAAAQKAGAADTPFDASNQYSFLGSFIRSSGLLDANLSTPAGALGYVGVLAGTASRSLIPSTYAVSSHALLYKDGENCPDTGLQEIGVACDGFGLPSYTMSDGEMNADIIDVIDFMTDPEYNDGETSYVDEETGEANEDTDYSKFLEYCANRQINYGQTNGSISDEDYAWETGANCVCREDVIDEVACTEDLALSLPYFRTYTMDKTINDADDDDQVTIAGKTKGGTRGTGAFKNYTVPARGWWSGGAGGGIDGNSQEFGNWRGDPVDALSTWIDAANGGAWGYSGGYSGKFDGLIDIAIGGPSNYSAAAGGSMDGQLRTLLQSIKAARAGIDQPTVIRPFHELNGNWYEHSVNAGNLEAFRETARRWSKIAKEVYPEAIWEISFNGDSANTNVTAEQMFEDGVWDAIGVDRYNQYPWIGGGTSWEAGSNLGTVENPIGAEKWRQFAEKHGVPLSFPEYANNATNGDDGYWVKEFFGWVQKNAGTEPGQVFSEAWFNIKKEGDKWHIYPGDTHQPNTAKAYADLFPFN